MKKVFDNFELTRVCRYLGIKIVITPSPLLSDMWECVIKNGNYSYFKPIRLEYSPNLECVLSSILNGAEEYVHYKNKSSFLLKTSINKTIASLVFKAYKEDYEAAKNLLGSYFNKFILEPDKINKKDIELIQKCKHIKDLSNTITFKDDDE